MSEEETEASADAVPAEDMVWLHHAEAARTTGFWTMLRRLPSLIGQGLKMSWRASPRDTVITLVLSVLSAVMIALGLLATAGALNQIFAAGPTPERIKAALPSLVLVGLAIAARSALMHAVSWMQQRLAPQVELAATLALFDVTTRVELIALDDPEFHDSLKRAAERGTRSAYAVVNTAVDVIGAGFGLLAVAGSLAVLHPALAPLLLLAVLPKAWGAIRAARDGYFVHSGMVTLWRRHGTLQDLLREREPAPEIRVFGMRSFLLDRFAKIGREVRDIEVKTAGRTTKARALGDGLGGIGTAIVYAGLAYLLLSGRMPFAVAGTAAIAVRIATECLNTMLNAVTRGYEEGLYFTDYLKLRDELAPARIRTGTQILPSTFATIKVDDVHFTYPESPMPALRGIDLEMRRGQVVALVGENGSGKTTLAKLIAGLYRPDQGVIRFDDVSTADADPDRLSEVVSLVPQVFMRWPFSVRDNITLGESGTPERVRDAASAAGADRFIDELPKGYDTLLDRTFAEGRDLSGGQWQRLAISRGFYHDTPLLICDEPTSSLDARAEHELFERIRKLAHGRTVLLITHRLVSVRMADYIYVLDHGKVSQHGSHDELMAEGGLYQELYSLQASAYAS